MKKKKMSLNKFTIQKSFAINAGAGSGKTYTLSRRYINAILGFDFFREKGFDELYYDFRKPASTKQIVTITYTEAAALEMKERIFGLISKILEVDTLSENEGDKGSIDNALSALNENQKSYVFATLNKALNESSDAKISTIHSFCLDILRTNADIARFDASIEIVKEDEKAAIINESIFSVLNDPKNTEEIKEITKYLNLYFLNNIFQKYATNSTFRDAFNSFDETSLDETTLKSLIFELYPLPDKSEIDNEVVDDEARADWLDRYFEKFYSFNAVPWNQIEGDKVPSLGKKYPQLSIARAEMDKLVRYYSTPDKELENLFYKKISMLKDLMQQIQARYNAKLHELGKLDFDAIILKTHEIIQKVTTDIKYMMVDEFQDTNSVQYEIIKYALNENSNLFVVGDSKQSIYSFQGAEIEVFNDAIEDKNYISCVEPMDINYRSDGMVLKSVNEIFDEILKPLDGMRLLKQNYEASPQALHVSKDEKSVLGTFRFLINSKDKSDDENNDNNEYEQIARLIANIKCGKLAQYQHIKEKIDKNEKAIAVVFDASTKMLELKHFLSLHNIECKVSASENYYHTKEINDIFNLLMVMLKPNDDFYKAAALRSGILRFSDDQIHKALLDKENEVEELTKLRPLFQEMSLSQFVLYIYEEYTFQGLWEYIEDSEQRKANLEKFLFMAMEYERNNGDDKYGFLKLIEKNIYFSDVKENEAFFKSDNLESIELCTIHSTKGLAYPMVILANTDKNVYLQIQSDSIKYNSFSMAKNNSKKLVAGFKIKDYEPLAFRVLKQIDKLKHLAEKKRLLYVALTRAEHDIVISGSITNTKTKGISISDTSFLGMILKGLSLDPEELYLKTCDTCISNLETITIEKELKKIKNDERRLKPLHFEEKSKSQSATQTQDSNGENDATKVGTITHKIFELYWDKFEQIDKQDMLAKFEIEVETEKLKILNSIEKFKTSDVYKLLKDGVEHRFELEFNYQNKTGFIDLIYYDKERAGWVIVDFKTGQQSEEKVKYYQTQLEFYEGVLNDIDMNTVDKKILWV